MRTKKFVTYIGGNQKSKPISVPSTITAQPAPHFVAGDIVKMADAKEVVVTKVTTQTIFIGPWYKRLWSWLKGKLSWG